MWIEHPPAACHPLVTPLPLPDLDPQPRYPQPDVDTVVQLYPLRPDLVDECEAWAGATRVRLGGGAALLLGNGEIVGLGDYVLRDGKTVRCEPAAGIDQRYVLAITTATPVTS